MWKVLIKNAWARFLSSAREIFLLDLHPFAHELSRQKRLIFAASREIPQGIAWITKTTETILHTAPVLIKMQIREDLVHSLEQRASREYVERHTKHDSSFYFPS